MNLGKSTNKTTSICNFKPSGESYEHTILCSPLLIIIRTRISSQTFLLFKVLLEVSYFPLESWTKSSGLILRISPFDPRKAIEFVSVSSNFFSSCLSSRPQALHPHSHLPAWTSMISFLPIPSRICISLFKPMLLFSNTSITSSTGKCNGSVTVQYLLLSHTFQPSSQCSLWYVLMCYFLPNYTRNVKNRGRVMYLLILGH